MSPRFGTRNLILGGPSAESAGRWLCYFSPLGTQRSSELQQEELPLAFKREAFWGFHEYANPEAIPFLRRLLPFLMTHQLPHWHLWLEEEGEIVASLLVGEAPGATFLFNLAVAPQARGRGLTHQLLLGARARCPLRPSFFWTRHRGFFLGAGEVYGYAVLD